MDDFERELKTGFLDEASQLLSDVEQCFLSLENSQNDPSLLDQIFRLAHNLKGSAKAVGFDQMGEFAHQFESFLLKVKTGDIAVSKGVVSLLLACNDHLVSMVGALKDNLDARIDSTELLARIQNGMNGQFSDGQTESALVEQTTPSEATADSSNEDEIRPDEAQFLADAIKIEEVPEPEPVLNTEPRQVESVQSAEVIDLIEMAPQEVKPTPAPALTAAPKVAAEKTSAQTDESIRVSLFRLEKLLNYVGEMVILQTVLSEQVHRSNPLLVRKTAHQMGKVTKEIQDISMSLRMVPVKQTFMKMQRIVRDTAQALGKTVQLHLEGEETELDKTVLESISDPLVHLIRNAVDHGIESAEKRRAAGKAEAGEISLRAYHQSGRLVIEVKDDGGGINHEVLKKKAIEKGILRPDTQISERDAVHLIFHPGFSTKQEVTEVSGRGVGMDVVKTNIEKMQGEVLVETVVGKGTCFKVILPLTLAIIDGMIVTCGDARYVIPMNHVHELVRPGEKDIQFKTGIGDVLLLRGENLPIYRLDQMLNKKREKTEDGIAVVVRMNERPFSVYVDDVLSQHQVVIKKLGNEIQNVKGFSGSAILGDGKPALILELQELVEKESKKVETRRSAV